MTDNESAAIRRVMTRMDKDQARTERTTRIVWVGFLTVCAYFTAHGIVAWVMA